MSNRRKLRQGNGGKLTRDRATWTHKMRLGSGSSAFRPAASQDRAAGRDWLRAVSARSLSGVVQAIKGGVSVRPALPVLPRSSAGPGQAGAAAAGAVPALPATREDDHGPGPDPDRDARMAQPFDTSVPNVARIYNCLLGGKDNFAADREAARKILDIEPRAAAAARQNREFLRRTVRFLAGEAGIGQFLDIGAGLPAAGSVHEVAQALAPESRVVYVDSDPVVLSHARALLVPGPQGRCAYIDCDLRDTPALITQAARTLDFTQPIAVLLIAVLHFIPDADDPGGIVRRLMAAVPAGSYLVVSHATPEHLADAASAGQLNAVYAQTACGGVTPRPLPEITKFFDGLELADPGVADIGAWRPAVHRAGPGRGRTLFYGGVARKPAATGPGQRAGSPRAA